MVWAYAAIVVLTVILVIVNVQSAVNEFQKHRFITRLASQLATLVIVGVMLITVSYFVVNKTMDAAASLQEEALQHRVAKG